MQQKKLISQDDQLDESDASHPAMLLARVSSLPELPSSLFDPCSTQSMLGLPPCHLLRSIADPRESSSLTALCRYTDDNVLAPARPPALPDDVRCVFDRALSRFYYYSETHDVSTWSHPSTIEFEKVMLEADLRRHHCSTQVKINYFFFFAWFLVVDC